MKSGSPIRWRLLLAGCVATVSLFLPASAQSQQPAADTPIAAATALRDRGDLAGAVARLRPFVAAHPEDVAAARLLAETLYWLKDPAAAREVYETALARHQGDESLRLAYGRMLREIGDGERARTILEPLEGRSRGRAELELGTLAYWEGDLSLARAMFIAALRADSSQADARRQLREIATTTAPWVSVTVSAAHDDQPLDRRGAAAEAGWFPTPASTVWVRGRSLRYSGDTAELVVTGAEVGATHFAADIRLESEAAAGALRRSTGGASDWTGQLGLGLRLPRHVALRVRARRDAYFNTLASLTTSVMTNTATALLALQDANGWLGEVAAQHETFPDTNAMSTAYGWLLAPVYLGSGGSLRVGYGVTSHTTDKLRFVLANPTQPYPVTDPRFRTEGRYDPYYTPSNQVVQSALASVVVTLSPSVAFRLNGSYGVSARESAPAFKVVPTTPGRPSSLALTSEVRSFNPWTARGALEIGSPSGLQGAIVVDALRTAFYTGTSLELRVTHHFIAAALSRADR